MTQWEPCWEPPDPVGAGDDPFGGSRLRGLHQPGFA